MAKKFDVSDNDVLYVVLLLKLLFSGDKNVRRLLEKVDTPDEIAKIHTAVQELVDLVSSL